MIDFLTRIREAIRFKLYLPARYLSSLLVDWYYGIDTEKTIKQKALGFSEDIGEKYESTPTSEFKKIIQALTISRNDVLLDMGSGKGKVLILAGKYGFKKVIGVDISEKINRIAQENIKKMKPKLVCKEYQVLTSNASTFEIPIDVTHIYFFNPFPYKVMEAVMIQIKKSTAMFYRPITLVYYNPKHAEKLECDWTLKKIKELLFKHYGLYKSRCNIYLIS